MGEVGLNFYNDIDPKACAWLSELMAHGLIPLGVIDNRSITDIDPNELTRYTQCHFFAGIGGWSLALRYAGWPEDRPVWTGSCPCQPFSVAGKRKGEADERHLWPAFRDIIAKCRPPVCFGEQVASADGREWLAGVRADLEAVGYAVGAADLCAAGVGAPHLRQRLYWVADSLVSSAARFGQHCGKPVDQPQPERIGAPCRVADAKHDGRRADEPGRGSQGRTANWRTGGMADMQCPRLEGHTGDVRDRSEPGRDGAHKAGSVAEGGPTCIVGDSTSGGRGECRDASQPGSGGHVERAGWARFEIVHCRDGKARRFEPGSFPLAHGVPGRVGLLRGYGNAIVPQVAAEFISAFLSIQ